MIDNIEVFTQSSIRIKNADKVIYIDPFEMKETPHDADYIFITHDHYDHFSPEDIKKITKADTHFVVPEKLADKAGVLVPEGGKLFGVKPGIYKEFDGLEFETVPAYNNLKPFHPKAAGYVGYILRIDHKRIYIAGDTSFTKDAQAVRCDIALVPIGGKYTMNPQKAAELVNIIRPEVAIPTHYGTIVGKPEDADTFKAAVDAHIKVVTKIKF